MPSWYLGGLEDDMRPRLFALAAAGAPFGLATIVAADGGPRPAGAQMTIAATESWGFLSGGCIEDDVALNAREVVATGEPRTLVYGRGSPYLDMRLACGGRLEVLVERIAPDEPALAALRLFHDARVPALWLSDGRERSCVPADADTPAPGAPARARFDPPQRLLVVGADPFALAIADLGARLGWDVHLLAPFGPGAPPPVPARVSRAPAPDAIRALAPDRWTAVAVATHDTEDDEAALTAALAGGAGYVGVLGARARLPDRIARLRAAGVSEADLARLHAPIGLPIAARGPWEVAVSVVAEIVAFARDGAAARHPEA